MCSGDSTVQLKPCTKAYRSKQTLTTAVQSILIHLVPCVTAADEAPNGVITIVFTASISSVAFIDVCGALKFNIYAKSSLK